MYLDQARSILESLLREQSADMAPPTGIKRPNSTDQQDTKLELKLAPYRHSPGSLFGDIPFRATRSGQPCTAVHPTNTEEAKSQNSDIAALKRGVVAKDRRIAELEAELARLRDDTSSLDGGSKDGSPKDEVFRAVVTKYKSVKKLYFDTKKEVDDLSKQVEELKMSDKTSVGKDKVIEAWKEEYERLSKQLRSQDESNDIMKMWREKYDALLVQHDALRETTARSIEELRKENSSLRVGRETISRELEKTQLEMSKVLINNEEMGAQVSRLTVEAEKAKQEAKRAKDVAQQLRILWQGAGRVFDSLALDSPQSHQADDKDSLQPVGA